MKNEKKFIISKRRYIDGVQQDFDSYIQADHEPEIYEWTANRESATKFFNQRAAVDFLDANKIEGATIENI